METQKTLDQVISESFDFKGLSPEEVSQAKINLEEMILENTMLRIFDEQLEGSKEKYERFQKQLALYGDSPESTMSFLQKEVPEFYEVFYEELELIKKSQ